MRKNLPSTLLLVIFTFAISQSFAQLSGTKVIGSSPSDYATFTAAVSALNSQGVNGNLIFNVKPGTYTERISINQISGAAANKTVTFKAQTGDSTSVVLQMPSSASATNNYVIQLNGADYISFKNMTIKRTDTLDYSIVIDMKSGAKHNTFANNIISGNTKKTSSSFKALVTSDNVGKDCYNTFNNNIMQNGDYGIYFLGQASASPDTGNVVSNNKFLNQAYRALHFTSQLWLSIKGNTITTTSQNINFYAIYAQYSNDTMRITKNKIALASGFGIYMANCNEASPNRGLIANNFIAIGGASTANGIYLTQTKNQDIYYNSVNIYSTHTTSGIALYISGITTEYITVKNNLLVNTGGGFSYFVTATAPTTVIMASDYNDLYTTGVYIGSWKSNGNITSFANWKSISALETHSVSVNPGYTSPADLHTANATINGAATPYLLPVFIPDDIDGNIRSTTNPDMGADEFSPSVTDVGISSIVLNPAGYCPGINFQVAVRIRNFGTSAVSAAMPVYYKIGSAAMVNATTAVVNIASGDSLLYTFSNFESFTIPGNYHIKAGTNLSTDMVHTNDTTGRTLWILSPPVASAGSNQQVCSGKSITLTATGGVAYLWSTTPPGTSASVSVSPLVVTTYNVTVTSSQGCTNTAQVTITPVTLPDPVAQFTYAPNMLQVSFTSNCTNATQYHWAFGDGGTSTNQNPVHTYTAPGNFEVWLIASNICAADTTHQSLGITGMDENALQHSISFGPNPASDMITINVTEAGSYAIVSLEGQLLLSGILGNKPIDISQLNAGIYFLRIADDKGKMFSAKFVKE